MDKFHVVNFVRCVELVKSHFKAAPFNRLESSVTIREGVLDSAFKGVSVPMLLYLILNASDNGEMGEEQRDELGWEHVYFGWLLLLLEGPYEGFGLGIHIDISFDVLRGIVINKTIIIIRVAFYLVKNTCY